MATQDENLKTFLAGDATVAKLSGGRIHENNVPQGKLVPYIYFAQSDTEDHIALDDAAGSGPFETRFDLECWALSIGAARTLAAAVRSRLHKYRGTFGTSTVQGIFVAELADDYEPRAGGGQFGFHSASFSVRVFS